MMDNGICSISAAISTYNRADLLPRAIDSVINQTYPPRECIVVDDGSEDETAEVVRRYGDRVRYIYQPNAGQSAAINTGVRAATSPWIALLDSDDYWDLGFLGLMNDVIQETNEAADVYFSDMIFPENPDPAEHSLWAQANFIFDDPYVLVEDGSEWVLMPLQPVRLQTSVMRRSKFLAVGGFHEGMWVRKDQHFFMRIGLGTPMCAAKGVAVYVGDDAPNRLTDIYQGPAWINAFLLMYGDLLSRDDLSPEAEAEFKKRYGEARYNMSSFKLRESDLPGFLTNLASGIRYHPRGFLDRLRKHL